MSGVCSAARRFSFFYFCFMCLLFVVFVFICGKNGAETTNDEKIVTRQGIASAVSSEVLILRVLINFVTLFPF